MEFVELTETEFGKLDFSCGNFLQSVEMCQRYKGLGREVYLVGVREKNGKRIGKILAAGLMTSRQWHFGKKVFRVAGGWLMDYDAGNAKDVLKFISEEAGKFCKNRGGMLIEISPNIVSQPRDLHNKIVQGVDHLEIKAYLERLNYKYLGEYEQVKWGFVLDLEGKTADELFKNFRQNHRWLIRRAIKDGVRVRELDMDELGVLKEIAAEAGERHGFQDPEMDYYRSMKEYFGDKVKFVVAELPAEKCGGKAGEWIPLAASMFVNNGREMVYLYSGSVRKMQKYSGIYLIQWEMIQEALRSGCKRYNFYGTKPIEGNGVYLFKRGFKGYVEELLGTFALPLGIIGRLYLMRVKMQEMRNVQ